VRRIVQVEQYSMLAEQAEFALRNAIRAKRLHLTRGGGRILGQPPFRFAEQPPGRRTSEPSEIVED
jgi:hypothetical protein